MSPLVFYRAVWAAMLCSLFLAPCVHASPPKRPIHLYVRPGDPLRFVYEVGNGGSMAILAEGPLRARCFLVPPYDRDVSLDAPGRPGYPASLEVLAARLGLDRSDLPPDVETLWRTGAVAWPIYSPGAHVPIAGDPRGPHMLVGHHSARLYTLAPGRGYLLIAHYMVGFSRLLHLPAPTAEFVIRPNAGLPEMIHHPGVYPSDIGRHLSLIDAGHPVDWSELAGYYD